MKRNKKRKKSPIPASADPIARELNKIQAAIDARQVEQSHQLALRLHQTHPNHPKATRALAVTHYYAAQYTTKIT